MKCITHHIFYFVAPRSVFLRMLQLCQMNKRQSMYFYWSLCYIFHLLIGWTTCPPRNPRACVALVNLFLQSHTTQRTSLRMIGLLRMCNFILLYWGLTSFLYYSPPHQMMVGVKTSQKQKAISIHESDEEYQTPSPKKPLDSTIESASLLFLFI